MTLALFYDTETSGLPLFHEPSEDPRQPHIVQIGAALVDLDTRKSVHTLDLIVRPDGWEIPDEVAAVHGITTDHARRVGIEEHRAVDLLMHLWGLADTRIAHNEQFDARILRIALMRQGSPWAVELADFWKAGPAQCTARMATPIMQLPPTPKMRAARRFHHKTPNLAEAVLHFTGKPLQDAHSAMADVKGCMDVYFAIAAAEALEAA